MFAPAILNPEVIALTELTVQERKKFEFVIERVSWIEPPLTVVKPDVVCPLVPQALSDEVKLIAETSMEAAFTAEPRKASTATAATIRITTTTTTMSQVLFFGVEGIGW
ncbi:MAG: hypothetical protein L3K23_06630 [Thermoplasmata archaeon]|nr:hypothetical protein [Thermoplasmata archaeon]